MDFVTEIYRSTGLLQCQVFQTIGRCENALLQARALVGTSTHDKGEVWLDELLVEWDAATDDASRLAAVNEAVSEAGYRIDCSIAGVRHAIGLVLACTLIAVSASVAGGDYGPLWMVFPMGLFGMGGCILAGRAARKRVQRARRAVDAIVDLLTVDLNDAAIVLPPARSRRPRRRGRRF